MDDPSGGVVGTLYQLVHILGGPDEEEFHLLVKWIGGGTFPELAQVLKDYQLELDSRDPAGIQVGKPGGLVFGKEYPGDNVPEKALGVFIPEGQESAVLNSLNSFFGPIKQVGTTFAGLLEALTRQPVAD